MCIRDRNGASNTSMHMEMIVGAAEYYDYTKYMAETYQRILDAGLTVPDELRKFIDPSCFDTTVFKEMVGIAAPDDKTIVYTCTDELSYFPSVATYNCLYPLLSLIHIWNRFQLCHRQKKSH